MIFNLFDVRDSLHIAFDGGAMSEDNNYELLLRFNPDESVVGINFRTVVGEATTFTNLKGIPTIYYPLDKVYDKNYFIEEFNKVFKVSNFGEALVKHVNSSNLNHTSIIYDNFYEAYYTGGERTTNIAALEALKSKYDFHNNLYYSFRGSNIVKIIRSFDVEHDGYMVDPVE